MYKFNKQKWLLFNNLDTPFIHILRDNRAVIAGGAVRAVFAGEPIADYDIYVPSTEAETNVLEYLEEEFEFVFRTDNAITFKNDKIKVQLIIMPENIGLSNDELLSNFDFTIAMGLYDLVEDNFVLNDRFLRDVCSRELVFNAKAKYPIASMYRMKKFLKRGYKISGTEIVKMSLAIHGLKIETYRDLKPQLMGIDTLFLKDLTDLLLTPEYAEKKYDFNEFLDLMEGSEVERLEERLEG
jgi:hypothetical protein